MNCSSKLLRVRLRSPFLKSLQQLREAVHARCVLGHPRERVLLLWVGRQVVQLDGVAIVRVEQLAGARLGGVDEAAGGGAARRPALGDLGPLALPPAIVSEVFMLLRSAEATVMSEDVNSSPLWKCVSNLRRAGA